MHRTNLCEELTNGNFQNGNSKLNEKQFNIMAISGFDLPLFEQLINQYQELFEEKDIKNILSHLNENLANNNTTEDYKKDLRQSKIFWKISI